MRTQSDEKGQQEHQERNNMVVAQRLLPSMEEFIELSRSRRSVRGFDGSRDVPDEYIEQILEAARWAPSAGNGQPWHFIVIRDPENRAWNAELFAKQLEVKVEMEHAVGRTARVGSTGFKHAPVHIVIAGDPRVNETYPVRTRLEKGTRHFYSGLANTTITLMLAARCLGLATQYVSDAGSPYMATMLKVRYRIPDPLEVYELVPVGWPSPKFESKPPARRSLDSIVHHEQFEADKLLSNEELMAFLWQNTRLGAYGKLANKQPQGSAAPEQ
jgi:nitroreductase